MAYTKSIEARNEGLDAMLANLNGGKLQIYTGSRPASPDSAAGATLLAELALNATAFAAASAGSATANAITQDSSANATGTAGWFRLTKADGTTGVLDGVVTATSGGGELELVSLSLTATQPVQVTSLTISMPT